MRKYKMTFDNIRAVLHGFCDTQDCDECPLKGVADASCDRYFATHPEEAAALIGAEIIEVEDKPRLTEQELAICKALGAKWVSREKYSKPYVQDFVLLWQTAPSRSTIDENEHEIATHFSGIIIASVSSTLFPSVGEGDLVNVEELLKDE